MVRREFVLVLRCRGEDGEERAEEEGCWVYEEGGSWGLVRGV